MNTVERLLEKSKEAFTLAIEIYNKPTIHYRLEGFSFFICNAWELMLKAHLINQQGEQAIYYPDDDFAGKLHSAHFYKRKIPDSPEL